MEETGRCYRGREKGSLPELSPFPKKSNICGRIRVNRSSLTGNLCYFIDQHLQLTHEFHSLFVLDSITWQLDHLVKKGLRDFPGGAVVKNPPANAGETGSSPGPGRSHMLWSN